MLSLWHDFHSEFFVRSDVANELASHEVLGCIQLWLSNIDRAEAHYAQCLRLAKTSHQIEILGKATAGLGYCALTRGNFNASLEHLHAALSMLRSCNERQEVSILEYASPPTKVISIRHIY